MLYAGPEGTFTIPSEAQRGNNFNGCGDAATAAIAHGLVQKLSVRDIAALAMRAAAEQAREA
jgi:sugar/nucleoside kinase (ribokinase family)